MWTVWHMCKYLVEAVYTVILGSSDKCRLHCLSSLFVLIMPVSVVSAMQTTRVLQLLRWWFQVHFCIKFLAFSLVFSCLLYFIFQLAAKRCLWEIVHHLHSSVLPYAVGWVNSSGIQSVILYCSSYSKGNVYIIRVFNNPILSCGWGSSVLIADFLNGKIKG